MVPAAVMIPSHPAPWPMAVGQEGLFVLSGFIFFLLSTLVQVFPPDCGSPAPVCWMGTPPQLPGCCLASLGVKGELVVSCLTPGMDFPLSWASLDSKGTS